MRYYHPVKLLRLALLRRRFAISRRLISHYAELLYISDTYTIKIDSVQRK